MPNAANYRARPANSPTISVIMNAYNRETVIHFAIESVLAQTFADFELIIIDDASTDRTAEIASYYAMLDPRITLVRNVNNSRAWHIPWESKNDGLRVARGALIAYLDSDNTWAPEFLQKMSDALKSNPNHVLAHCNSRNFYSDEECARVIATDRRKLLEHDHQSTIFSHEDLKIEQLGFEAYIDTNEMMHKAEVFEDLGCLWRVYNPRRDEIQKFQGNRFPYRRHNDIDFVTRVVEAFGAARILHVKEALTNFYYPSATRPKLPANPVLGTAGQRTEMSGSDPCFSTHLNLHHFQSDYLKESAPLPGSAYDFGIGTIKGLGEERIAPLLADFGNNGGFGKRMFRYRGQVTVAELYRQLGREYGEAFGKGDFGEHAIVPFHGCQNGVFSAIMAFASNRQNLRHSQVAYQLPAASYWSIIAATQRVPKPIVAYSFAEYIDQLERCGDTIGVVLLNIPHNPLGILPTESDIQRLAQFAERVDCKLLLDMTYYRFAGEECLNLLAQFPPNRTIFCDGISKSWGLPGLRCGFAICPNLELATRLRAQKSGESFLPSSIPQAFFHELLCNHRQISDDIVEGVNARRKTARSILEKSDLARLGISLGEFLNTSLYEVLYFESQTSTPEIQSAQITRHLQGDFGIKVLPDTEFFPPILGRLNRVPFIRLSVGSESRIEEGISHLVDSLAKLLKRT